MDKNIKRLIKILHALQQIDTTFPLQYAICLAEITLHEGLCMTELAERTKMPLSTVSRITSALSKPRKGNNSYELITITVSPSERRRKQLALSDHGRLIMENIHNLIQNEL